MPKRSRVTLATVRRLALAFPGVEEGLSYGTPGFRVRGKFLARMKEDGETLVVKGLSHRAGAADQRDDDGPPGRAGTGLAAQRAPTPDPGVRARLAAGGGSRPRPF
jgi:hypothetical protein